MNINRENYEIFFIDYLDGNLSPAGLEELVLFLQKNPDLEDELYSVYHVKLPLSPEKFDNKLMLKKGQNPTMADNLWDELCVSFIEGQLNESEKNLLQQNINPANQNDFNLFLKTKINPDKRITYPYAVLHKKIPDINESENPAEFFEHYCIDYIEENLDLRGKTRFENLIAIHPSNQELYNKFSKTKLKPDLEVQFDSKNALKHFTLSQFYQQAYITYYAIAAAIIAFFLLFPGVMENNQVIDNQKKIISLVPATSYPEYIALKYNAISNTSIEIPTPVLTHVPETIVNENSIVRDNHEISPIVAKTAMLESRADEIHIKNVLYTQENQPTAERFATGKKAYAMSLKDYAGKVLNEELSKRIETDINPVNKDKVLNGWTIAKIAVKGINSVAGTDIQLKGKHDHEGNLTAYSLNAGFFQITRGNYGNH